MDAVELSYLIGLIYDAAIDPDRWPIAMEAIRGRVGMFNCSIDLISLPDGNNLLNYMTNVPDPYAARMAGYTSSILDIWGGTQVLMALPYDEPSALSQVVGTAAYAWESPFFREWGEPQGICDVLGIFLARDVHGFGSFGMARHRDGPPIEQVIEVARLFVPHLQRAASINRLLDLAALRDATFDALFDTLTAPVLVVDEHLTIVHANRAGRALIGQDDALRSRGGVLSAADRAVHHALSSAINDATSDYAAIGRKGMGIPLARRNGSLAALHVLPLRPDHPGGRHLAAIFVAAAGALPAAAASMVGALFGLTPTESAVFEQVAGGCDVPGAAARLGIAQSTVRTHLLRIYDKTGVRRQAELVRLSASLAVPVGQA